MQSRVERIRRALDSREAVHLGAHETSRQAAVVVMLRPTDGDQMDVLLVRRAERAGDPWSGHIGLPGGRRQVEDATLLETALRETHEETGVDIRAAGEVLGELDELTPRMFVIPPMVIRPFVAALSRDVAIRPNEEIADVMWTPLRALAAPEATGTAEILVGAAMRPERVFRVGDAVVWGLTERILRGFLELTSD